MTFSPDEKKIAATDPVAFHIGTITNFSENLGVGNSAGDITNAPLNIEQVKNLFSQVKSLLQHYKTRVLIHHSSQLCWIKSNNTLQSQINRFCVRRLGSWRRLSLRLISGEFARWIIKRYWVKSCFRSS
jgi:hypothetical protein